MRLNGDEMFDAYREYRESAHDDEPGEQVASGQEAQPPSEERNPEEFH